MKLSRKILSIVLALIMMFGIATTAFAGEKTLKYLVLGDSIGYGAGVLNSDEACFGRIVADTTGFDFTNDAINGYRTSDLIKHLEKEKISADVKVADIISISIGGNDFLRGDMSSLISEAKNGNYTRFDEITAEFYENFCKIIAKIKELNPNATIIVQTLYNPGNDFVKEAYQQGADRLNARYRQYIAENVGAYELIDVAKAFAGHSEYIAPDYIHPNAEGNVVIAKLVLAKLNELKLTDKTELVIKHAGINQNDFFTFEFIKYIVRKAVSMVLSYVKSFMGK
ncbi:MAG: SGNH/GDSL hydrolase family protein [Clostridia bacterium]|nr:SGNH/GDSL hydrolase family protein [Clostridia bacterium]